MHQVVALDRGPPLTLVVHDEHIPRHDILHGIVAAGARRGFRFHVDLDKLEEPLARGGAGPLAVRLRATEKSELHQRVMGAHADSVLTGR